MQRHAIFLVCLLVVLLSSCTASRNSRPAADKAATLTVGREAVLDQAAISWGLGVDLVRGGNYKEALPFFDYAIRFNPSFAYAWAWRGLAFLHLGQNESAMHDLYRAIAIDPCYSKPYLVLAMAQANQGKGISALNDLTRCQKLDPGRFQELREEIAKASQQIQELSKEEKKAK